MNALLLINSLGGNGKISTKLERIKEILHQKFEKIDAFILEDEKEFIKKCQMACGVYDSLIFAGGDGTFHLVVNALKNMDHLPILGVIPSGTLCDAAKNFGATKNVKHALDIILKGEVTNFDIGTLNDEAFVFSSSFGVYADIPYSVNKKSKKYLGHFSYYFKALPELFERSKIDMDLTLENDEKLHIQTPFLLVMNSKYMAGFKINKTSKINDGYLDVFYSKCEPLNGLFSYFFIKKRITHHKVKAINVKIDESSTSYKSWDVDGEEKKATNATIKLIPNKFKMFYKNKNN